MAKEAKKTEAKATQPGAEGAPANAMIVLNKNALSTDVGPMVLASLAKAEADDEKAAALKQEAGAKRYDALTNLTLACVKAAKADETINLAAIFGEDAKTKNLLFKQIRLATGLEEIKAFGKGEQQVMKQVTAASVEKYFPSKKDAKDSDEYRRKQTFRTNFTHQLTKSIQAACGIIDHKMEAKADKSSGTLLLTGPAVEKAFGTESVLLDEKQKVREGDKDVTLKVKPSFSAIANLGAQSHGKVTQQRSQSGNTSTPVDADTAVVSMCSEMVKLVNKLVKVTDKQKKALESVVNAITTKVRATATAA